MSQISETSHAAGEGITVAGGQIRGPVRRPVNLSSGREGSIHDDATATKLGFRGGTVAGSIHMDQFPPVLVRAFGQRWFEDGTLSLNFRNAMTSGEPVVAVCAEPSAGDDAQVAVRMEREDGMLVAEGTASVGVPSEPSHLHDIDLRGTDDPSELRLLSAVRPGDPLEEHEATIDANGVAQRIERGGMTEPLDWYTGASPWGGAVANPSSVVQLLWRRATANFGRHTGGAVGLFGAIEVRHVHGPVFLDRPYRVTGEVVAVGQSPKTEYVWFDAHAHDADGTHAASMRMQLRWMKASARQYQDGS